MTRMKRNLATSDLTDLTDRTDLCRIRSDTQRTSKRQIRCSISWSTLVLSVIGCILSSISPVNSGKRLQRIIFSIMTSINWSIVGWVGWGLKAKLNLALCRRSEGPFILLGADLGWPGKGFANLKFLIKLNSVLYQLLLTKSAQIYGARWS